MFNSYPIRHLIKSYDEEARQALHTIGRRNIEISMLYFGKWSISVDNRVMETPFRESARIIDEMASELNCLFDKRPQHHTPIDIEAMEVLSQGLKAAALKFSAGFNMHGAWDCSINNNKSKSLCSRCRKIED